MVIAALIPSNVCNKGCSDMYKMVVKAALMITSGVEIVIHAVDPYVVKAYTNALV